MSKTAVSKNDFPPQIKYIVGNEVCERFSFYGMRAILTVFMVDYLMMPKHEAVGVYHWFVSAAYFTPLLGAYISDRYWGKYRTIMTLSIVYCLGHAVLALFEGTKDGLYWGLALIALGSGGIKPCVSTHVGDQFTDKNKHLITKIYDIFYFSINFGSFFSTLLTPWVLKNYGPSWAFGIPGILMAVATLVFWYGHPLYVNVPPTGKTGKAGFLPVLFAALTGKRKAGGDFFSAASSRYSADEVEARAVMDVCKVFITVSVFWALFDQHGSSWVLQAQQMNLNFLGVQFEASQIAALNPIMVMVMIPLFAKLVYPAVEKATGYSMTPLRRMSAGMVIAATSFVAAALVQAAIDGGSTPSIGWQFIQYLLITTAEIAISITGLEFAYTQAPRSMKSTIMSFFFLTIFLGNVLTAYVAAINKFQGASFYWFFAALMAGVSGVFIWTASRYKVREYIEDGSAPVGH